MITAVLVWQRSDGEHDAFFAIPTSILDQPEYRSMGGVDVSGVERVLTFHVRSVDTHLDLVATRVLWNFIAGHHHSALDGSFHVTNRTFFSRGDLSRSFGQERVVP